MLIWGRGAIVGVEGNGFIQHPDIAPVPMGLSIYHQLHCLDGLRHAYWHVGQATRHDHHHHETPSHIRHCIDYLRQSLLCHADTNLEPIDFDLGGVKGFGSARRCRDVERVKEWAEKWKAVP
ncbi:hypothetical protein GGS20DRAFT_529074 [Poronia punctata]|nr:hypothetical protein GGS20DRAFT_529074 [Poronia punctata]